MTATNWHRVCPGLYVDDARGWVISRDDHRHYTVRVLLGWGPTMSGDMFPDYGSVDYGAYFTIAEAMRAVDNYGDEWPATDRDVVMYRLTNPSTAR